MFKKIKEYFASVDLYTFVVYFACALTLATAIFGAVYGICFGITTHCDITITLFNGDIEVVHCASYDKLGHYLIYVVNGKEYYVNLDNVLTYSVDYIECDCNNV